MLAQHPGSMAESNRPFISIIIPTYERPERLVICLKSLMRLDYPRERFEVIVVDDWSRKPPETVVARFHERFDVMLLTQTHAGPATARNTGATLRCNTELRYRRTDAQRAARQPFFIRQSIAHRLPLRLL